MNWKPHLIIGIITAIIAVALGYYYLGWFGAGTLVVTYIELAFIIIVSPLVADIDHENGKLGQVLMGAGIVIALIGVGMYYASTYLTFIPTELSLFAIIAGILLTGGTFFTAQFSHHRGFTHSLIFGLIYAGVIFALTFTYQLAIIALVGYWSHLAADGIPFKIGAK